jgi:hypothetical protein
MASDDDISVDRGASQPPLPPHPQASDDAELHTVSDSANCAENYYKNEGSSLKMLVAMCHGLRDGDGDESLVIDLTANPWKSLPVMQIRPSREFYAKEVLRRCAMQAATSDGDVKKNKKVGQRERERERESAADATINHNREGGTEGERVRAIAPMQQ